MTAERIAELREVAANARGWGNYGSHEDELDECLDAIEALRRESRYAKQEVEQLHWILEDFRAIAEQPAGSPLWQTLDTLRSAMGANKTRATGC